MKQLNLKKAAKFLVREILGSGTQLNSYDIGYTENVLRAAATSGFNRAIEMAARTVDNRCERAWGEVDKIVEQVRKLTFDSNVPLTSTQNRERTNPIYVIQDEITVEIRDVEKAVKILNDAMKKAKLGKK